jgi:predicted small lipoprotein YifL
VTRAALLLALVLVAAGCGIKGEPLTPSEAARQAERDRPARP